MTATSLPEIVLLPPGSEIKGFIFVCPSYDCGNYYGARNMPDLATAKVYPRCDDPDSSTPKGTRDECPDCKAAGRGTIHRVIREFSVTI